MVIAVGILTVVLYFYQQSASLRAQLIEESERISAVRLLMDRLTAELRGADARTAARTGFSGGPMSLRFPTATLPMRILSETGAGQGGKPPDIGVKVVSYSLSQALEGTNLTVTGLVRTEQSTVETRSALASTESPAEPGADTNMATNRVATEKAERPAREPSSPSWTPVTDAIRFLRFRYSAGESWQTSWTGTELPRAVEVSFGLDPLPEDAEPDDYPFDVFRRVIYLPASEAGLGWEEISIFMDDAPVSEEETTP